MVDEHDDEGDDDEEEAEGDEESLDGVTLRGQTTLGEADYLAVWNAVPQFRWLSGMKVWFVGMLLLALPGLSFFRGTNIGWIAILVPLVYLGALTLGLRRGKNQFARNVISDMGGGKIAYQFADEGFAIETPRAKSLVAWESLAEAIERPDYFLVYTSPQQFVLVAKRAFSEDDVALLREMLAERIVKKPLRGVPRGNAGRTLVVWVVALVGFLAVWQFLR